MILITSGLGEFISGVILYDETIRQKKKDGTPFVKVIADAGIIPGIKVDAGAKPMAGHPGEKITEGLDGLRDHLAEYSHLGARCNRAARRGEYNVAMERDTMSALPLPIHRSLGRESEGE